MQDRATTRLRDRLTNQRPFIQLSKALYNSGEERLIPETGTLEAEPPTNDARCMAFNSVKSDTVIMP
jgi:hypothetical protein